MKLKKQEIKDELIKDLNELLIKQKNITEDTNIVSNKEVLNYDKKMLKEREKLEKQLREQAEKMEKLMEEKELKEYSAIPKWKKNLFY